jgi:hypothetical protein
MRRVLVCALVAGAGVALAAAQQQPPATDVYLAELTATGIKSLANISNNAGYDNQPSFLPDSSAVLFSSIRDGKQSDIYRYDIASAKLAQVTRTPEPEYSPTVTPDGRTFSVVRVEADGAQRLWRFDLDGSNPRVILENVKPVGYHAWIDDTHLALFILGGGGAPATLQIADTTTGTAQVAATGIGRSILIRPRSGTVSFMTTGATRVIREYDPRTREIRDIAAPIANSQDAAWTPGGALLMASGSAVHAWSAGRWSKLLDVERVASITRLAVSPDGRWIALVGEPPQK